MADHTVFGPLILPQAAFRFTGAFQPNHDYRLYDFLVANDGLYLVLHDFTSGDTFVFGADAQGPFYQFICRSRATTTSPSFSRVRPAWRRQRRGDVRVPRIGAHTVLFAAGLPTLRWARRRADRCPVLHDYQDATQIGTLDFAPGGTAGTFTLDEAIQFNARDTLRVMRPVALDDTALDLSILFAAAKGTL